MENFNVLSDSQEQYMLDLLLQDNLELPQLDHDDLLELMLDPAIPEPLVQGAAAAEVEPAIPQPGPSQDEDAYFINLCLSDWDSMDNQQGIKYVKQK